MLHRPSRLFLTLFAWFLAAPAIAAPRYVIQYRSGKQISGNEIINWHEQGAEPQIGKQRLFFPGDQPLWIEDRTIIPAEPRGAYVEFVTGDRITGEVAEFRTGRESPYRQLPPHLIITAGALVDLPDATRPAGIPIHARWLKRVVWQKVTGVRSTPGTLIYRDGRRIAYRSLRWSSRAVRVLLDEDSRTIPFTEIAEINFPKSDSWNAWLDQLALIAPTAHEPLIQVETSEGIRLTGALQQVQIQNRDPRNPERWFHGFLPAWSLEPLWLSHRTIRMRRYFEPRLLPATLFEPSNVVQKSSFGGSFPWRRDTNVQQLPLRCGLQSFGWGLGVQAYSALTYELPPFVVAFSSLYGLDLAAGGGGCVQCAVYGGPPEGKPLFQSPILVGTTRAAETGRIVIPRSGEEKRQLSLVVDPRIDDRPEGADPYEIRDLFDWLQPTFEFDLPLLQQELARRGTAEIPAWQDWRLTRGTEDAVEFTTRSAAVGEKSSTRVMEVAPRESWLSIERNLEIGRDTRYLLLSVARHGQDVPASQVQVHIDEQAIASFDVPTTGKTLDVEPLLLPITPWQGKSVRIELVQIASAPGSRVEWQGIGLVAGDPALRDVLDDNNAEEFLRRLTVGTGSPVLSHEAPYSGKTSLRISDGARETTSLPGGTIPIRETPALGEYRYLRFAWKGRGKGPIALDLARDDEWGATEGKEPRLGFRYRGGTDEQAGPAYELRNPPPGDWESVTRDLYEDFGPFDLTGMRLSASKGTIAEFDLIAVARRKEDLDRLPASGQGTSHSSKGSISAELRDAIDEIATEPPEYGAVLAKIAPQFATTASEQGVWLLRELGGRKPVVRTYPRGPTEPCVLRAPLEIPAGAKGELVLSATHHPGNDWRLVIRVGDDVLRDQAISEKTTRDGWVDLTLDLSRFAGHAVVVEVQQIGTGKGNSAAYWSRLQVNSKSGD